MHHSIDPRNASHHHNQAAPLETRRVFSGKVTKILDTFGFIDNDVFFQPSVVRGGQAKVGDSVYVECQYSEHLPFKWNATRVQIIPPQDNAPSTGNKQQPAVSSSYVPQTAVGMTSPMSHGSSSGPIPPRDDPRQSTGNNYWQSGSTGSGSNATSSFAGASRNPLFVSEYAQQPQDNTNTGPSHHFSSGIPAQSVPTQPFPSNNTFPNAPMGNGNSVTYTTTPGSAFLTSQIPPKFDPSVSIGPFPGGPPQHSGPPPPVQRENRASRWEPREARSSGLIHRDSDDRRRHDRRDMRIDRERKDGKDEFGRDRPPPESRNSRFNERQREKSLSPGSNTGSVSSRYDSKSDNLPKYDLLPSHLSSLDIRTRYGSKIHIPSDFETLLINTDFEMDLNSIPKPIRYKIHEVKKRKDTSKKSSEREKDKDKDKEKEKDKDKHSESKSNKEETKSTEQPVECSQIEESTKCTENVKEDETKETVQDKANDPESVSESEILKEEKQELEDVNVKSSEASDKTSKQTEQLNDEVADTNVSLKEESNETNTVKYNGPKHGVKVILLSLPEMNAIYEKVFGYDFERQSTSGYHYPLNKLISFLVFRNQNDGYSLIGGKFNPQLDGLLGDKPNLIATAIRCVKEQAGIDLTLCSRWMSLGSFLYNREDSLNERPHTEYSTIFMPDIWTLLDPSLSVTPTIQKVETEESSTPHAVVLNETSEPVKCEPAIESKQEETGQVAPSAMDISSEQSLELEKLDELKVVELKSKLDELGIKYSRTLKKAELLSLLRERLAEQMNASKVECESSFQEDKSEEKPAVEDVSSAGQSSESVKRPLESDGDTQAMETDEPPNKKVATDCKTIESMEEEASANAEDPGKTCVSQTEATEVKDVIKEKIIDVTGDFSFSLLTLHQGLNHHKHDHFELSICAELLRESLIRSFGYFIASSLNENSSNLSTSTLESSSIDRRKVRAPNYIQLVFSYFDERHIGSLSSDDLLPLLIHCGYNISKKSWQSLTSNCDKIQYKHLNTPNAIVKPLELTSPLNGGPSIPSSSSSPVTPSSSVIVKDGIVYNCENLIKQADKFAKAQIQLHELTQRLEERDKQLNDFETRQKKMTSAIEKQNDEICALKRERESLRSKVEEQRKVWNSIRDSFKKNEELFAS